LFTNVRLKPNVEEAARALDGDVQTLDPASAALQLAKRADRTVFLTRGERGMIVAEPTGETAAVPGVPVSGPIDPTGAGDSASAGILLALAAGAHPIQAALVGNLTASITVQQLRTTGVASPAAVQARFREWSARGDRLPAPENLGSHL
jgi:sugar/nucleoside kinase (ribokinase family)